MLVIPPELVCEISEYMDNTTWSSLRKTCTYYNGLLNFSKVERYVEQKIKKRIIAKQAYYKASPRKLLKYGYNNDRVLHDELFIRYGERAVIESCTHGHLDVIKWLNQNMPHDWGTSNSAAIETASRYGYMPIVKYLHQSGRGKFSHEALNQACAGGYLSVVKYLHENSISRCNSEATNIACKNGYLHILEYLHLNGIAVCTKKAMELACEFGHYDIIVFLNQFRNAKCSALAMERACEKGYLKIVIYLHTQVPSCYKYTDKMMDNACIYGHLEIIKYLHENEICKCTAHGFGVACSNGHLDTIKYLHENKLSTHVTWGLHDACHSGYLDIVRFICENNLSTAADLNIGFDIAVAHEFLEVVEYLAKIVGREIVA